MRTLNRVLAPLLAVVLLAVGLLLAVEVVAAAFHRTPALVHWHSAYAAGQRDAWDTAGVRVICGATAGVGLLLLLSQLKRRRPDRLPLTSIGDATESAVTRPGVRTTARVAALTVDGVSTARVKVARRSVRLRATSRLGSPQTARELTPQLTEAVEGALERLQLRRRLRVRATVRPRRGSES